MRRIFPRLCGTLATVFAFQAALLGATSGCGSSQTGSIGAVVGRQPDKRYFIRTVPRGMAAEKAGLEVDDELLAIDGKDVHAMSTEDLVKSLRGDVGSTVVLTIVRRGVKQDIKVERGPFAAPTSPKGKS